MIGKILDKLGISKYLAIILSVLVLTMVVGGYFYFDYTQEKMAKMNRDLSTLRADNLQLKTKIEGQTKTIDNIQKKTEQYNQQLTNLNKDFQIISESSQELVKIFAEHDLNKLTVAKPKLIENRINSAIDRLRNRLENDYGNYDTEEGEK